MQLLFRALFLGFFILSTLHGKILFDLQEQYFEHPYEQSAKSGLYKLPYVSVSTVNISQSKDGKYTTEYGASGTFIVKLDEPIGEFNISVKGHYKSTYQDKTSSIVLKDLDGNEIFIAFKKESVSVGEKVFKYAALDKKVLHVNIKKVSNVLRVSINGVVFSKYVIADFTKLKRVEQTINNVNGVLTQDALYDMVIVGN